MYISSEFVYDYLTIAKIVSQKIVSREIFKNFTNNFIAK